ncbi:MAG TPA: primosomal protein N' [Solirubrobacterales bacterium]|nr:primosomal protein N' [Solirubrobacterales bacterium]
MAIAKVEPLTTARALRGPFDYLLPARLGRVDVGSVLVVPFGRRRLVGVVVEVVDSSELPPERLAEPIEALEAGATPELVRLGLWIAREYCSTPARGLELVLPPGVGRRGRAPAPRREVLASATEAGRAALAGGARLGTRQREALEALADDPPAPGELTAHELEAARGVDRRTLRRLASRGLVTLRSREARRRPAVTRIGAVADAPALSAGQRQARDAVVAAMDGGVGRELLLHGVTGSGKTEVYLAAARAALERGRGVIVLVPEIALTPQTVGRFAARFGDHVAVLHSRLSGGERRDEWHRVRRGEARVCVGPRSAAFAPVADLGLVVIDEEHDPSYKQDGDPRYDAREVVRRRAAEGGAAVVAGSATPRPETWLWPRRLELAERIDGRELPQVEVVDLRERSPRSGPLHPRTSDALADVRDGRGKAIVLLNRRGWSPFLSCGSCGRAFECPRCDVSLVVHRRSAELRCHHCGHSEPVPDSCPGCDSVSLARHGAGTEQLASMLAEAIAPLPVFRLDSDSVAHVGAHAEILRGFDEADAGVLVGTQMVAKGHDFPDVVLSVVLDADATLRFPDFRAEERTFALVAQLAGRSGRGDRGGRVLVQTLAPEAAAIRHAAAHDAPGFLAGELARRRALSYPPFSSLVRIELAGPDAGAVRAASERVREALEGSLPRGTELLGPAPRFRLRGRHRRQLLLKAQERTATVAATREALERLSARRELGSVALSVDVDPQ